MGHSCSQSSSKSVVLAAEHNDADADAATDAAADADACDDADIQILVWQ